TLITDVGSTKTAIVSEATQHLRGAEFMGGHPITGKEKRGIENADADLFRNRPYVLTSRSESANTKEFVFWLNNIGATVIYSTPAEHDRILGYTSHLPQLLSTALAVTLARQNERAFSEIFGPGLTDMTRLALSSGDLWIGILKTNKEVVKNALLALEQTLEELAKCLDADQLDSLFTRANEFAEKLRTNPKA
ncbi:MAG: prephenate dehydrogenase/arogenate dehydrogenase family protein, partial [Acidobacteriaceae bacterium]|nr:prephenate dehydrogenase/arogenate dehydrogenase family protein [Acidobacteriaceae bacterium]